MRAYVKSAGRKASQDYVWLSVGSVAEVPVADAKLLSHAERSTTNRGRVASFAGDAETPPYLFALFFGNVDSGRSDFCGTPILNRAGFVFDAADEADVKAALNLAADWYSARSRLEGLLGTGIAASDEGHGFAITPDFGKTVSEIASTSPDAGQSPNADMGLFDSIRFIAKIAGSFGNAAGAAGSVAPPKTRKGNTSMKVHVNTVPSGELDYGWYVGGRPAYGNRLWDICERVRSVSAETAFFAALAREPGAWVVFAQDIIGRDEFTMRPARGTVAIEVPDTEPDAQAKARRILREWLLPDGRMLGTIKRFVDVTGEEVKADMSALLAEIASIAVDDSKIAILRRPQEGGRIVERIAKDRSNFDALRRTAAQFAKDMEFPDEPGVHLLFTNTPYSEDPQSPDALPQIPAKFIVLGWRKDSWPPMLHASDGRSVDSSNINHRMPKPEPSPSRPVGIIVGAILAAMAFVAFVARGCGGCGGRHTTSIAYPAAATNSAAANLNK